MLFPPKNCHFAPFFIFFKKYFSKNFRKNALDVMGVLSTDESITIDIVHQLQKFLGFSRGVTPFCKNKGSPKLYPSWNFFCCEP